MADKSRALTRRAFLAAAASIGASFAYAGSRAQPSRVRWVERRERFAEGVASSDPTSDSVILWTRLSSSLLPDVPLIVEVAEDAAFTRVVARTHTRARASAGHTSRVLVGGLRPARNYWYRFTLADGSGRRIGRTRTAPAPDAERPVNFAFVSRQDICEGSQHANAFLRLSAESVECEFVCIPRPSAPTSERDGGPIRYRVVHRAARWPSGGRPRLEQRVVEGDPDLAL